MDRNRTIITTSAQETQGFGQKMADSLVEERKNGIIQPAIFCLYGELGAGKTTFTQGFVKGLGIATRLLSPTFIIVRRYSIETLQSFLYHIDLYRVKSEADFKGLGLREIFADPQAIILIEWAERLSMLPKVRTDIIFKVVNDEEREIVIERK